MNNLPERLRQACNGYPHARVAWPHRLLHEAAEEIERLTRERDRAVDNAVVLMRKLEERIHERDEARAEVHEQARLLGMSAERELQLMAEVEQMRAEILAHLTRQAQLQGEYDERQRDAERYRWLQDHYCAAVKFRHPTQEVIVIDDAAIDAAMREGESNA